MIENLYRETTIESFIPSVNSEEVHFRTLSTILVCYHSRSVLQFLVEG